MEQNYSFKNLFSELRYDDFEIGVRHNQKVKMLLLFNLNNSLTKNLSNIRKKMISFEFSISSNS